MKKKSVGKIVAIIGIFALLLVILLMVIIYKVKWQNYDNKKYLYFYSCLDYICVTENITEINNSEIYSKYECKNTCPSIKGKEANDIIILNDNEKEIKFNYKTGTPVDN